MMTHLYNNIGFGQSLVALFLMTFMLYNNIHLYKDKFSSPLSRMLVCGLLLSLYDVLWDIVVVPRIDSFQLTLGFVYICTVIMMTISLLYIEYVTKELYDWPRKPVYSIIATFGPLAFNLIFSLMSVLISSKISTEDIYAIYQKLSAFSAVFTYVLIFIGAVISAVFFFRIRKGEGALHDKAADILMYSILSLAMVLIDLSFFDQDNQYGSIIMSVSLCFLTIRRNTRTLVQSEKESAVAEAELSSAAAIQLSALPKNYPAFAHHNEIMLNAAMYTAREVGGDFYDYFELGNNRVCFVMADVSGKGIPAALFMMKAKSTIKNISMYCGSTSEIFNQANIALCEGNDEQMFATAWIGILDTETLVLQYTNAGHNYPYVSRGGESFVFLSDRHGLFLGGLEKSRYRQSEIQLAPGDSIFLYTDGLTEAHNGAEELYSDKRLADNLNEFVTSDGSRLLEQLKKSADDFSDGAPQFDDITMMIISIESKKQ